MTNPNNLCPKWDDFLGFIQKEDYRTRAEWRNAMNSAAEYAERDWKNHRRSKQPYLRDRADGARIFRKKLGAVLYWLHHDDFPDTSHNDIGAAIQHIQQCLTRPDGDIKELRNYGDTNYGSR